MTIEEIEELQRDPKKLSKFAIKGRERYGLNRYHFSRISRISQSTIRRVENCEEGYVAPVSTVYKIIHGIEKGAKLQEENLEIERIKKEEETLLRKEMKIDEQEELSMEQWRDGKIARDYIRRNLSKYKLNIIEFSKFSGVSPITVAFSESQRDRELSAKSIRKIENAFRRLRIISNAGLAIDPFLHAPQGGEVDGRERNHR